VQGVYASQGKEGAPRYVPGVVNLEFKYDVGLLPRPPKTLPVIFTVEGHMSNMFFGPCAPTAAASNSRAWRGSRWGTGTPPTAVQERHRR
jgi:hypothetical protein